MDPEDKMLSEVSQRKDKNYMIHSDVEFKKTNEQ